MRRSVEQLLPSYYELIKSLLPGCHGICILDRELEDCGSRGTFNTADFREWLRSHQKDLSSPADFGLARKRGQADFEIALGMTDPGLGLLAILGVALSESGARTLGTNPGRTLRKRLKAALEILHREIVAATRGKSKVATLSQRTRDLEWLFGMAAELKASSSNRTAVEHLLAGAAQRMRSAYCALILPARQLLIEHAGEGDTNSAKYQAVREQAQAHLLGWAQRHRRALVMNTAGMQSSKIPPCKLLSVRVTASQGAIIGALVFINPPNAADYSKRHSILAGDVAREATQLLQSQYDLATGLLTRSALEESYRALPESMEALAQSVLHVDIDRLHVINNAHGHEIGDTVISMIAHLLAPPILPPDALIARIAGDQFVMILPSCDTQGTAVIASSLQKAVGRLHSESIPAGLELTLSCGISSLVPGPMGLKTALVSAESACHAAKERGRNRIETFGFDDSSIIQRHGDALRMLSLEDALKTDRFELFGQPIVPLSDPELPGGFEVLLRLRNEEGTLSSPDEFLPAAHRYQMMPAIDRWVLDHTLSLVEAHSSLLMRRQISLSINVTGHSLADDRFVDYLLARARTSHIPARLLTIEITEQTAVRNLKSAIRLMNRLREAGCGVALDDFGTGTNSLVYLRDLPVTRVKIDGSFVRDIPTNPRAEATLKSIVELLRPFDVDIVAEYVENEMIIRKVRQLGIDYAQGFAYGRPGPLAAALDGLKNDESRNLQRIALEF